MMYPILKLINVNKYLSDFFFLKDISIELNKGEVHVLMGENGSGKSCLMNIIWGAYIKDSGDILIDGVPVSITSPMDAKRLGIAMIHQDSSLFEHFTIAENIYIDNKPYLNKKLKIIDWGKMYSDCQLLFKKLGFTLNSRNVVKNLSVAEKQLVEICKAYISKARIIIMDEPTSSLTESEALLLFNIIRELKRSDVSIFYITHRFEEVEQIGDRISVIRGGEIVGTQNINDMNVDNIIHMMTGLELKERYPKLKVKLGAEVLRLAEVTAGTTLKNINFSLRKHEILGIIGLVGSGRTKIAKCIFGIDKIDSGDVYINNKIVDLSSPAKAIAAGIGCVTEDRTNEGLFTYLNIPKNITAPNISRISNHLIIDNAIEREIASTYVDRLGIKIHTINDKPAYLSGGNQQKVVLAKWIMSKSKILILDEPTKGIDIPSKIDVYNVMNEMVTKGISIILISSDVDEVVGMCDRTIVLFNGKISAVLPSNEANREKIMAYATGGKHS